MSNTVTRTLAGFALACSALPVSAADPAGLRTEILAADAVVFGEGFNRCRLDRLEATLADGFIMFHDQGGRDDRAGFMAKMRANICAGTGPKPVRRLLPDATAIYPLKADGQLYGAIQTGEHEFLLDEPGKPPVLTNLARFTHVWLRTPAGWRLHSVLSFDHVDPRSNGAFDADALTPLFDSRARVEALLARHGVASLAIGQIQRGQVTQLRVFGTLEPGRAAPLDAIYNVASLAKPVSALTVLKLAEAGLWDLDRPLAEYFVDPDLKDALHLRALTTRHVLSHRSGLPNWRYLTKSGRLAFEFRPGERVQYSGEGFELLRKAVEAKLRQPFDALAAEHVFRPAGMTDTSFRWPTAGREERIAPRFKATGERVDAPKHDSVNAAANLMTTVSDYSRFTAWVLRGAGLRPDLRRQMLVPGPNQTGGESWGLGWTLFPGLKSGGHAIQHTGGDDGIKALAVGLPDSGSGLVVLSNSDGAITLWKTILTEHLGPAGAEITARNLDKPAAPPR